MKAFFSVIDIAGWILGIVWAVILLSNSQVPVSVQLHPIPEMYYVLIITAIVAQFGYFSYMLYQLAYNKVNIITPIHSNTPEPQPTILHFGSPEYELRYALWIQQFNVPQNINNSSSNTTLQLSAS